MPPVATRTGLKITTVRDWLKRAIKSRKEYALKISTNRRRSILLNKRGLIDFRIHKPGEYSKLKSDLRKRIIPNFYMSLGHGDHQPNEPKVKIPNNVYLVFVTKAGLPVRRSAVNYTIINFLRNKKLFIKFLTDDITREQKPSLSKYEKWHWTDHIYPPGSLCESHSMYFKDNGTNQESLNFNRIAGTHTIGTGRMNHHGEIKSLQALVDYASNKSGNKKCMLFIFGCRGDPRLSITNTNELERLFQQYTFKPQNYNIPYHPGNTYIQNMRNIEKIFKNQLMKIKFNERVIKSEIRKIPLGINGMPNRLKLSKLLQKYSIFFSRFNSDSVNRYVRNTIGYRIPQQPRTPIIRTRYTPVMPRRIPASA